jgi:hypothetical protein
MVPHTDQFMHSILYCCFVLKKKKLHTGTYQPQDEGAKSGEIEEFYIIDYNGFKTHCIKYYICLNMTQTSPSL